jgi:hypothetical protein
MVSSGKARIGTISPISGSTRISDPFRAALNAEIVVAVSGSLAAADGKVAVFEIRKTDCAGISFLGGPLLIGGDICLGRDAALEAR